MQFPDFYAAIPGITVYDPLAALLGAPADGRLHYTFADAVKLAGHACPTVAGAWLMTVRALTALYPETLPQRGNLVVSLGQPETQGVSGVIGAVAGLLTGAAGPGGFAGLGGQHARRNLLHFGLSGAPQIRFTRRDTGRQADCQLDLQALPAAPRLGPLLSQLLAGTADETVQQDFAQAWQERLCCILLQADAWPGLLQLRLS